MYISKFRIKNYKSFLDSGEVNLLPGINIITGQNNAGKTALMESLSLNFNNKPHRSTKTVPNVESIVKPDSIIEIGVNFSKQEIMDFIFERHTQIYIPIPNGQDHRLYNGTMLLDIMQEDNNIIQSTIKQNQSINHALLATLRGRPHDKAYLYRVNKDSKTLIAANNTELPQYGLYNNLISYLFHRIYNFRAERMKVGECQFGNNDILKTDASNLPEVLNILQSNKERFERYNKILGRILPNIYRVSVRPKINTNTSGLVEIVVWNEDPEFERSDLVVPLSESGTGISQVLAILYVIMTADLPKIILIDEPNSFLHPGAAKKLMEILKEHPQHQFIISTHSPEIIASANPSTIHIIKTENAQSTIIPIDVKETKHQQLYLTEIGSRLSDIFGADNILWVEGKTEEICFPKIIAKTAGLSQMGTSILAVKNTGDFDGKHSKTIFDIYSKLTKGQGLMPPAVGFIFDREKKTEQDIRDIQKQSDNKVLFTQRRMFENYIIHPKAIYAVLNSIPDVTVEEKSIIKFIDENRWKPEFIVEKHTHDKTIGNWQIYVNGAKFLEKMFSALTESKVLYDKIEHSVALAEWLIDNSFEELKEYQDMIRTLIS